jgi:hypothetical protein
MSSAFTSLSPTFAITVLSACDGEVKPRMLKAIRGIILRKFIMER